MSGPAWTGTTFAPSWTMGMVAPMPPRMSLDVPRPMPPLMSIDALRPMPALIPLASLQGTHDQDGNTVPATTASSTATAGAQPPHRTRCPVGAPLQAALRWSAMSDDAREQTSLSQFAEANGIRRSALSNYVTAAGELKAAASEGMPFARRPRGANVIPSRAREVAYLWWKLSAADRVATSFSQFAIQHDVSASTMRNYVDASGTWLGGPPAASLSSPSRRAALMWYGMSREERAKVPFYRFAREQGVSRSNLLNYVDATGTWLAPLPPEAFADAERPRSDAIPAAPSGHPPSPPHAQASVPATDVPDNAPMEVPDETTDATTVKDEPVEVPRHAFDNSAPILQTPEGGDALLEALQPARQQLAERDALIDRQKIVVGDAIEDALVASLQTLPDAEQRAAMREHRARIAAEARDWLKLSPEARAQRLDAILHVVDAPGMGRGVKAAHDLPPFAVIGPYAGRLLRNQAEIDEETARYGRMQVDSYAFQTAARTRLVSAFRAGNVLSLINEGNTQDDNNVGWVRFGGNLTFYVTRRAIAAGEDLLIDYGDDYVRDGWPGYPIDVD